MPKAPRKTAKSAQKAVAKKADAVKVEVKPKVRAVRKPAIVFEKSGEQLVVENFATLSRLVESLGETLELLVQKAENMAHHIIASEEILAELVAANGLDLARVNARIRAKIAVGTEGKGDSSKTIDIAASIASPLPRR